MWVVFVNDFFFLISWKLWLSEILFNFSVPFLIISMYCVNLQFAHFFYLYFKAPVFGDLFKFFHSYIFVGWYSEIYLYSVLDFIMISNLLAFIFLPLWIGKFSRIGVLFISVTDSHLDTAILSYFLCVPKSSVLAKLAFGSHHLIFFSFCVCAKNELIEIILI